MRNETTSRRIALIIHALTYGGAERVLAQLANHWSDQGNEVTLITLAAVNTDTYPLATNVRRIGLDLQRDSRGWWEQLTNHRRRLRALRSALQTCDPDVLVGFTDKSNILALQAGADRGCRIVCAERTDPRHHDIGWKWDWLRRRLYRRTDLLVVQTQGVADYCREQYRCRVAVIPNAAPVIPPHAPSAAVPADHHQLIAVGRLDRHKNFSMLLRVFARLQRDFPAWTLKIVGTGSEMEHLQQLIQELSLTRAATLTGWVTDIFPVYRDADLFVSTSAYEGFPNALLEAMACGLPAVAFDCPSGPSEIIRDGMDGLLIPNGNESQLEQALRQLMSDGERRRQMGLHAAEVQQRFSLQQFYDAWDQAISPTH